MGPAQAGSHPLSALTVCVLQQAERHMEVCGRALRSERGPSQLRFDQNCTELSPSLTWPEELWGSFTLTAPDACPSPPARTARDLTLAWRSEAPELDLQGKGRKGKEDRKKRMRISERPSPLSSTGVPLSQGCKWQGPLNLEGNPMAKC